jgi:hypothetical protein
MPTRGRSRPNPFYILLLVASTLFVVTALGYTVSPYVLDRPSGRPAGEGSEALARWLDRRGPLALGVECVAMVLTGILAMATDPWFSGAARSPAGPPAGGPG